MACEGKTKGIVTWKWESEPEKIFESTKCPVRVETTPITGNNSIIHWLVKSQSGNILEEFDAYSYNLFPNTSYNRISSPGNYLIEKLNASGQPTSQVVYEQPVTIEPTETTGCRIDIFDATGKVFSQERTNKKCPTYRIKCDDDCHKGEMKCECNHYPGYCCIPCNEVVGKINQAASTLRGIKS